MIVPMPLLRLMHDGAPESREVIFGDTTWRAWNGSSSNSWLPGRSRGAPSPPSGMGTSSWQQGGAGATWSRNCRLPPDTLFAIGSTTKAFTAATVGALVDDGLLEWERPLRDYVPDLRLHDPVVTDRLTVVDLLSHRSGLPRHDLAWVGHPGRSRAELVRRLRFLPLSRDLRQAFQYCNLGYLVGGTRRGGALRHPLGGFPANPAADTAWHGPLEPVGRRHARRPGPCQRLRAPPGRHRARATAARHGHGARRRGQLMCRRHGPVAAGAARWWPGGRPGRHVTRHDGPPARAAHADAGGPDLSRVHPARLRARMDDRPLPRPPARRARRWHRRVPGRVHAAAGRRHRRGRDDQHLLQRHGAGRRLPGAR